MSVKTPFRLTVDLSDIFDDHRRLSLILVREKYKIIGDLESRICNIFDVQDIYLCLDNTCIPSNEDIKILNSNDIVKVKRIQNAPDPKEDCVHNHKRKKKKRKEIEESKEINDDIDCKIKKHENLEESRETQIKKHKKRRKSEYTSKDDESLMAAHQILENITAIDNPPESKKSKNKIITPHNEENISERTVFENSSKLDSNTANKSDLTCLNSGNDMEIEQNCTSTNNTLDLEIKPKRKRVRKRYRKKKQNQINSSCNDSIIAHSTMIEPSFSIMKSSNNHIRFEKKSDGSHEPTEYHDCTENHVSSKKQMSPEHHESAHKTTEINNSFPKNYEDHKSTGCNESSTENYKSFTEIHNSIVNHKLSEYIKEKQLNNSEIIHIESEQKSTLINGDCLTKVTSNIENNNCAKDQTQGSVEEEAISKYGVNMDTLKPKEGDIVAFKMIKLSSVYTPEVSSLIVGKVLKFDEGTKNVELLITQGAAEFVDPNGKFSLDENEEIAQTTNDKQTLNWLNLIEPKLLYP